MPARLLRFRARVGRARKVPWSNEALSLNGTPFLPPRLQMRALGGCCSRWGRICDCESPQI